MIVCICGSRALTDLRLVDEAMDASGWADQVDLVLCGMAPGADRLGLAWARARGIPVEEHPADWETFGRSAGNRRNAEMVARLVEALPDAGCVALPVGPSPGTRNMIERCRRAGVVVWVGEIAATTRRSAPPAPWGVS